MHVSQVEHSLSVVLLLGSDSVVVGGSFKVDVSAVAIVIIISKSDSSSRVTLSC